MTTKLSHLRSQLRLLRWGRRLYRWGAAAAAVLAVALAVILAMFAVDVVFEAGIAARIVLLVLAAAALALAFWKLAAPWLFVRESDLDMALLVERRQGHRGRSDLAAALQFESPAAAKWGSPQLETAVIDRVAVETSRVKVFAGSSSAPLARRLLLLIVAGAVAGAVAMIWPAHVAVFFDRLALGSQHYPSRTAIRAIGVNGRVVLESGARSMRPLAARCAEGQPLRLVVAARGVLPKDGELEVKSQSAGLRRTLPLRRLDERASGGNADPLLRDTVASLSKGDDGEPEAYYVAELDRLLESLDYQVFLGDGWTDPGEIIMAPLPAIELHLSAAAPDYARVGDAAETIPAGARQLSVLEGSRIGMEVQCVNGKPLAEVRLAVTRGAATEKFPLEPIDEKKLRWRLGDSATPLAQIAEELRYALEVVDADGMRPAAPIAGTIRIRADRPPRITARIVTRVVLPSAAPVVNLDLADDYGVRRPSLELKIVRESGAQETRTLNDLPFQSYNDDGRLASAAKFPLTGSGLPWRGGCRVDLGPLKLEKGDRATAAFVVNDYRGENAAREVQAVSQPLELEVSDEAGVYRAALETDQQALKDITEAADLQQQFLRAKD